MSLERHDWSEIECYRWDNVNYMNLYTVWIAKRIYGDICDVGSGYGYPTATYAARAEVNSIVTNDKVYDEKKTIKDKKITRYTETTEEFMKRDLPKFDFITCTEHIEHLEEKVQMDLLEWVKKHLKDNGSFIGSMPNIDKSANPYHIKEYTWHAWDAILRKHFSQVELVQLNGDVYVWEAKHPL